MARRSRIDDLDDEDDFVDALLDEADARREIGDDRDNLGIGDEDVESEEADDDEADLEALTFFAVEW